MKINGALREGTACFNPGAGDDLAQSDGVFAGDRPWVGVGLGQDQGPNEIRADLVAGLNKGESAIIVDEAAVTVYFMETFGGEGDVSVFIDLLEEFTAGRHWCKEKKTHTAKGQAGFQGESRHYLSFASGQLFPAEIVADRLVEEKWITTAGDFADGVHGQGRGTDVHGGNS